MSTQIILAFLPLVIAAAVLALIFRGRSRRLHALDAATVEPLRAFGATVFDTPPTVTHDNERGVTLVGDHAGERVTYRVVRSTEVNWQGGSWKGYMTSGRETRIVAAIRVTVGLDGAAPQIALHSNARAARAIDLPAGSVHGTGDADFRRVWKVTGELAIDDTLREALLALQWKHRYSDLTATVDGEGLTIGWVGAVPRMIDNEVNRAEDKAAILSVVDVATMIRARLRTPVAAGAFRTGTT